jgi:hypothetical protein
MKIFKKANVNRYSEIELGGNIPSKNLESDKFHVYMSINNYYDDFMVLLISARNEKEAESIKKDYLSNAYAGEDIDFLSYPKLLPNYATQTNTPKVIYDSHLEISS